MPQGEDAAQDAQRQQRGGVMQVVLQLGAMYMLYNYAMGGKGKAESEAPPAPAPAPAVEPQPDTPVSAPESSLEGIPAPVNRRNLWSSGQEMDLSIYFSEQEEFYDFGDRSALAWHEPGLTYDWSPHNEKNKAMNVTVPAGVRANGSYYAHVFVTKAGHSPDPASDAYDRLATIYRRAELTRYIFRKARPKVRSLLGEEEAEVGGGGEEGAGAAVAEGEVAGAETTANANGTGNSTLGHDMTLNYWKPTLSLRLVHDFTPIPSSAYPEALQKQLILDPVTGHYFPTLYVNEFWLLREHLIEINDTTVELPLEMSYNTYTMMYWQLQLQMEESFRAQQAFGATSHGDLDEFKRMLTETDPWLLAITGVVSTLHMLFEFLAFKNDISFWRNKKNMEGMSVRSLFMGLFFQLVITLYLFDNDTSWMILVSSALETVMGVWKLSKALKLKWVTWRGRELPWFENRVSYSASKTKEYDDVAMAHLIYVLYPMVIGSAMYSLLYDKHKSWYSWVISSLVSFIYTFGFIRMTPQLFINYKLKSVAHMPWRAMVYKSLNTFIDDLFAFVIKMPLMHRLACFRDDIIFFIYLYQRWKYRVDPNRVNEYGQSGVEGEASGAGAAAAGAIRAGAAAGADASVAAPPGVSPSVGPRRRSKRTKIE